MLLIGDSLGCTHSKVSGTILGNVDIIILGLMLEQIWYIYMDPLIIFTGFFCGQNLVD